MFNKIPHLLSVSATNMERDAEIRELEKRLVDHPGDRKAAMMLLIFWIITCQESKDLARSPIASERLPLDIERMAGPAIS